jgi:hypothetical protein
MQQTVLRHYPDVEARDWFLICYSNNQLSSLGIETFRGSVFYISAFKDIF